MTALTRNGARRGRGAHFIFSGKPRDRSGGDWAFFGAVSRVWNELCVFGVGWDGIRERFRVLRLFYNN